MPTGNGAHVVHSSLERHIPGYRVCSYSPWWSLTPPLLAGICRKGQCDLVHTTPEYAVFFSRPRTPLVVTFHNFVLDAFMAKYSSRLQRWHYKTDLKWFTRIALKRAALVTAVSDYTASMVRQELHYEGPIHTIYNGIDTDLFQPGAPRNSSEIRVLVAGNMTRRKGADLLPEIARRLSPGITVECATGLRKDPAPQLLAQNIRFRGHVGYADMPDLYRAADMLLFPTVREGFGLVAAEAMACGLPVVASDCSSLPELIDDGRGGYLVPIGDVQGFADRVNELASSAELRQRMGEYNRAKAEAQFALERMIVRYRELFEEVLDIEQR